MRRSLTGSSRSRRRRGPLPVAAGRAPVSVEQAATLFGGQLQRSANQNVRLFGILALREGAAAIISAGDEPPHAVPLGSAIMQGAKLYEVRPRSIIIDRNGARSEVFLPDNAAGPPPTCAEPSRHVCFALGRTAAAT